MKKQQWITLFAGIILVLVIYFFGRTIPRKKTLTPVKSELTEENSGLNTDSLLDVSKRKLSTEQMTRINELEHSISRGDVKEQQLKVYRQLARFWSDSAGVFEPFAWYTAQAARLENSEKSLTFAARLFLNNLQEDQDLERKKWKALQARDLFERSLKINPDNDSAKVGLGACYLFGNISATPMEGILKIREVAEKDSTNIYAQMMLIKGSLISGQYDKAISRLETVNHLLQTAVGREAEKTEAILLLADTYDRLGDKTNAIDWYRKSLLYIRQKEARDAIEKRIATLKK